MPGLTLTLRGNALRPLDPGEIALVCVVRNAMASLGAFLDHHRGLGIARFVMVDDRSDDGTEAFLAAQPDVDLFASSHRYRAAGGGQVWRDRLIDLYGRNRWYVFLDADEYLVYPGSETRPIGSFIADLERVGSRRSLAPMLDLYPAGRLADAVFESGLHRSPVEVSPMIDGTGYAVTLDKFSTSIRGGPRHRLFGHPNRLQKYPVLFADRATQFNGASIHGPLPLGRNFAPADAVLLHFKFSAGSVEEFQRFAEAEGHFGGSMFYKEIAASETFNGDLSLAYPGSLRFEGSEDLVRRGFMRDLRA
ncbi:MULTISPECIES: glycosyltransferase family 2 protein [unclassified Aureimonas]|uniref:glycosyltransferase family 2 protein n=1 Tax=unclassified Aureimonas TaxID=2615206 RepID=UPI00138F62DD|nr:MULTISPECIES: glycosyltransferase family 2 protein [unclassified Aureimonas]